MINLKTITTFSEIKKFKTEYSLVTIKNPIYLFKYSKPQLMYNMMYICIVILFIQYCTVFSGLQVIVWSREILSGV